MSNQLTVTESNNVLIVSGVGPQGPAGSGSGSISDGDKGDITVSSSGATWTIDNAVVTHEKFQSIAGPGLIGRSGAGTGVTERIGLGSGLEIDASKNLALSTTPAAQSISLTAGTGLTGGGDLSANRSFAVSFGTSASTACVGNDSRLSDARTPTSHTHALADIQQGGATTNQVVTWNGSAWVPSSPSGTGTVTSVTGGTGLGGGTITTSGTLSVTYGSTASTACEGNDSRLSDARTPTAHNHAASEITSGTLAIARIPTGTTANDLCIGNDSRLSDSRDPTEHTHYAPQSYVGHIETPTARTYYIELYAPALTITSLRFKTSSGTVDVTVLNGASQVYTADGLGTTRTDVTTGLSNTAVSAGGTISLVVDAVSTPADLQFVIAYTTSSGGVE